MTRQELYNKLVERLGSIENVDKRPGAIWTDDEIEISEQRRMLETYLKAIENSTGTKKKMAENGFDVLFKELWSKLDKDGWK